MADGVNNNTNIPLDIVEPKTEKKNDIVQVELKTMDEMLKDPKCDYRNILNQVYKIAMVLHRLGVVENKTYTLDKDLELTVIIKEIKKSFGSKKAMFLKFLSGGAQIVSGGFTGAAVLPSSLVGKGFTAVAPKIGTALGSIGQGISPFDSLINSKAEGERALLQFRQGQAQRKQEDRNQAYNGDSQLCREALRRAEQADNEAHQAISRIMDSRS